METQTDAKKKCCDQCKCDNCTGNCATTCNCGCACGCPCACCQKK